MNGQYYMPARNCQMHFYKYSLTAISEKAQSELEELMELRGDQTGSNNYIAVFIKMLQINLQRIKQMINLENISDFQSAIAKPPRSNQSASINVTTSTGKTGYLDKLIKDDGEQFPNELTYSAGENKGYPKEGGKRNKKKNRKGKGKGKGNSKVNAKGKVKDK